MSALRDWLAPHLTWTLATLLIGAAAMMTFLSLNVLFLVWLERKVSGHIQRRRGPLHVGWHGSLQTVADMVKLVSKQLLTPLAADRLVYLLAPLLIFMPTLCVATLIPISGAEAFAEQPYGLVVIIALSGISVLAIFMAGWASNSKYSLLGGLRASAQMISYALSLILAVLAVVVLCGSLDLREIAAIQDHGIWNVVYQPVAFLIFVIASFAETNRHPFDFAECEPELVGGFHTEYSGMRFALFFFAEYTNMLVLGALGATLFLGGWLGPWLPGPAWLLLKAYALVFVMMWMRWTFPRLRFDQLMSLAWKLLIPVALVNLVVTALLVPRVG